VSNLEVYAENHLLTVVQAHVYMFGTPARLTTYSLSAGASWVHADIPAILIVPICPHIL
jgi:NAD+ kinase